ncbi:MAG: HPr family phosphocarrier protein [Alicyclobacillus herbarius]|uniref:HPr family phosphocarrier protein n=1 Tax=Alicyclobacillus herbarius TaxID=122960 RepID=UPI0004279A9A|nr:HPr family phosphocarrier protein [Alicyclobacillus herbarius]MCL6632493.1 HPr family phosphocarrier protein [Alicyclobacillus herbarius]
MTEQTVTIKNPSGLHARPAALLVQECGRHSCQIWIRKEDKEVDAKSILGVMSLAVQSGQTVTIRAQGEGEEEALKAVVALIESGLGE